MKKITLLLVVVILTLTCVLCACGTKYSWDDALIDIDKLKEAEFVVYNEDTQETLDFGNETLNAQIKRDGYDFTVEMVHETALYEDAISHDIVGFTEYATEEQAKKLYDYYMDIGTQQKFVRFGKILINTNSDKAEQLLGYKFKLSPNTEEW